MFLDVQPSRSVRGLPWFPHKQEIHTKLSKTRWEPRTTRTQRIQTSTQDKDLSRGSGTPPRCPYVLVVEEPTKGLGSQPYPLLSNHQDQWRVLTMSCSKEWVIQTFPDHPQELSASQETPSHLGAPSSKSNKSTKFASRFTKAHKEQEREGWTQSLQYSLKISQAHTHKQWRIWAQESGEWGRGVKAQGSFVSGWSGQESENGGREWV